MSDLSGKEWERSDFSGKGDLFFWGKLLSPIKRGSNCSKISSQMFILNLVLFFSYASLYVLLHINLKNDIK